jgi:predicted polyphosphate/ATP-dependent NAD kinase
MTIVGIIPNPASGKDIRRLVAKAMVVSNQEKVNIVSRMLVGLHATNVSRLQIMPDLFGIGKQAVYNLRNQIPELSSNIQLLDMDLSNSAYDSLHAAEIMKENGASCIIVLGGDGTTRIVSKGCGDIPLLPISTGTNNVLPYFVEGTIAGLCAGYIAGLDRDHQYPLCRRSKRIEVWVNGELADIALVDLAAKSGGFSGSRAVWDSSELRQIAVTYASPMNIGLSAVIGVCHPVSIKDEFGAFVSVNPADPPDQRVVSPIGPGLIRQIPISEVEKMELGQPYPIVDERSLVLVLDGERELVLGEEDSAFMIIKRNGPWIIDLDLAMFEAASSDYFVSN